MFSPTTFGSLAASLALAALPVACSSSDAAEDAAPGAAADASTDAAFDAGPRTTTWLCRPGLAADPCSSPLDATIVRADGSTAPDTLPVASAPKIDCFYVYPTVSAQKGVNADLTIDPEETAVARVQASRFSSNCRVFAPMYRQITLLGLLDKSTDDAARDRAYADVLAAFREYLAYDSAGRGFVLVGHSQGAAVLDRLVREEIDGDAALRARLVSALLVGGNVLVPDGADVGADFAHVPACRAPEQTGCVVAYSSFDHPPPQGAWFGRSARAGTHVLCTNPASLAGADAAELHPYFPAHGAGLVGGLDVGLTSVTTPWVTFPGLLSAHCETADGATWLQIDDVRADGDARPHMKDSLGPTWGLHTDDVNLALGDLVSLVARQATAFAPSTP